MHLVKLVCFLFAVPVYLTRPHHRLTALLYLYMCPCRCQLFTDEGSRRLPKRLNNCFSVLASATNQSIHVQIITLVSGAITILNLLSTSMSVILTSIIASRMPIQILGPLPNGMKAPGWMEDFLDLLNLQQKRGSVWYRAVCVNVCMCVSVCICIIQIQSIMSPHILRSNEYCICPCVLVYTGCHPHACVYMSAQSQTSQG